MYKCNECGYEFEYPEIQIETHGLDTPPYEEIRVCPYCGDNNIDEVEDEG